MASASTWMGTLRESARALLATKTPESSYPPLPALNEHLESSIPGLYFAGDLAGAVLIKTALNQGYDLVEHIATELEQERRQQSSAGTGEVYDMVIVGSGAAGFAATLRAHQRGLKYVTLEAARFAESIQSMTKGKLLFAEPAALPLKGDVWFEECTREELLERWEQKRYQENLNIRAGERVVVVSKAADENGAEKNGLLVLETERGRYLVRRVILAMGKAGNPRKAGVPGEQEHAAKIAHRLADPDDFRGRRILVYGGGDVAAEAALALADYNEVTLATIDRELVFPRKRNVDAMREKERAGRLRILLNTRLAAVHGDRVELESPPAAGRESPPNDFIFEMIGADLPVKFLKKIGVRLEGEWTAGRWAYLAGLMAFVYTLFALKGPRWPFNKLSPESYRELFYLFGQAPSFWYTVLFTVLVVAFGIQARRRWGKDDPYQRMRFVSFISFQVGFFLLVQLVLAWLIPQYYWRGWGLWQPFPLFFNTFFWWYPSDPALIKWFFIGAGLLLTFVVIPLFVRRHGMRFCTWVCGCGALAETLGDRWRHYSPKGLRSRLWEFQGPLVLAWAFLSLAVIVFAHQTQGNTGLWRWYDYVVDFWLVGVIPIALYPFFGGKVWCRYWCPLAHYMKLLSVWFGRLEVRANDKCIQCGECSKHCMVGVDVMAFAKNGQSFDNRNTSCVHCGICITVCPVDVLSFGLKPAGSSLVQIAAAGAHPNLS